MLRDESRIDLPNVPDSQRDRPVAAWREALTIDTYLPEEPDRFPAYLEKRVYQGSSGRVYPMPFHERISRTKSPHEWDAIHLENEWIRLVILPELGGRIHIAYDKSNGYDFFYRNNVIKPALVGVLGPWISGGVEFNWPQHHRPATMLPTDSHIEFEADGAVTVWCSDHDPFNRMKGMHGIRLRPDSTVIEARVRLFNRTEDTQTFLWWANVAARVDDNYQSFFPTDVDYVADHARRAITRFPHADGEYYGIDYPARVDEEHPDADRIDWYRNIPVPTSYMCIATEDDFFGGYDHGVGAGFVHWADRHISPGKKQWTWGNSPFGWAWDRNLTDGDGPYVELMAGVYTDNQPDFSYLVPGETKSFSQFWYPIQRIGVVHQATLDVAVHLSVIPDADAATTRVRLGVASTRELTNVALTLTGPSSVAWHGERAMSPRAPFTSEFVLDGVYAPNDLTLTVEHEAETLIRWQPRKPAETSVEPAAATEPPAPHEIASSDELFLTGLHLQQYRHATRSPEPYWREALRRDPGDQRVNTALATRLYDAARYDEALELLERAVTRVTIRNPNPSDGEPHYRLGMTLSRLGRVDEAIDAFEKAAWNAAWRVPAWMALARIDAAAGGDLSALRRIDGVLALDSENLQARDTRVVLLRRLGRHDEADEQLASTLALDPLDAWARDLRGGSLGGDAQVLLDVALEYRRIGESGDALRLVDAARAIPRTLRNAGQNNAAPLAEYYRAEILFDLGQDATARDALRAATTISATNSLPARLDDVDMLQRVIARAPDDARARAMLGHWLYFVRRYEDAIASWEESVRIDPTDEIVWRNLGVGMFNVRADAARAAECYAQALALSPDDPKLWYESDQLAKRTGTEPGERLARLDARQDVVTQRDDLTIEYITLLATTDRAARAYELLNSRQFQPWEGGEGQVIAAWDLTHLALARDAAQSGDLQRRVALLESVFTPPESLGEARHPLENCAELLLALGDAHAAVGEGSRARQAWLAAAGGEGSQRVCSGLTFYEVQALRRLGLTVQADDRGAVLREYVERLSENAATIDYFATSLPTMLLFEEDLQAVQDCLVDVIRAQLDVLDGDLDAARHRIGDVIARDPNRPDARELARELRAHAPTDQAASLPPQPLGSDAGAETPRER